MAEEKEDHAITNARGWAESIIEFYQAHERLEAGPLEDDAKPVTIDGDEIGDEDELRERIQESVLSVQVRGPWHDPGAKAEDDEFELLLTTGGPALRIVGDLDKYNQPEDPRLEWQNWGTPWNRFTENIDDLDDAIDYFCGCFYFGE